METAVRRRINSDIQLPMSIRAPYVARKLAMVVSHFLAAAAADVDVTEVLRLRRCLLYVQGYGDPCLHACMRVAVERAERVDTVIVQNADAHEEGPSPLWERRRKLLKDRAPSETAFRENFLLLTPSRQRRAASNPHPDAIRPDLWPGEFAFLNRPGEVDRQTASFTLTRPT
ncbi:hypothetical protein P0D69_08430 [Paraburkholderia sediminicola]|uniref:hypothetical protein n=1 Tax=Paraburkholderia sediminicola TaxID=458836 RepID=UPI0038BA561D